MRLKSSSMNSCRTPSVAGGDGAERGRGITSATSQKYSWPGREQNQVIQVREEVVVLGEEEDSAAQLWRQ